MLNISQLRLILAEDGVQATSIARAELTTRVAEYKELGAEARPISRAICFMPVERSGRVFARRWLASGGSRGEPLESCLEFYRLVPSHLAGTPTANPARGPVPTIDQHEHIPPILQRRRR